jgi:hypothetical protein
MTTLGSARNPERSLPRVLHVLYASVVVGVFLGGAAVFVRMDESSSTRSGRLYLGLAMLLALACATAGWRSAARRQ